MNGRSLPLAAAGLWLGELLAPHARGRLGAWWVPVVLGLALIAWSAWGGGARMRAAALGVAMALVGVGWGSAFLARVEASPLATAGSATFVGSLRTDPVARPYGWSAILGVDEVRTDAGAVALRGSTWVGGRGEPPIASRGDRVLVEGAASVPSDRGFADSLLRRGLSGSVRVARLERLGGSANAFIRAAQVVRAVVGRSIDRLFPAREGGLLLGLALGDDSGLDSATRRDFRATGLGHLLVVSGGNVAMVLAPVLLLLARLGTGRTIRLVVPLALVAFFVVLTGAEASVLRAGAMASIALVGAWLGRPREGLVLVASAAVVLLLADPSLAYSVGFQLSAGATSGMVLLATPIADRLRGLPSPVAVALGATLAAQAFVSPLLLSVFGEIPLSSIPANVLAAPAVSPAMLGGLLAAGVGAALPAAGRVVAGLALLPLRWLLGVADILASAPLPWLTSAGGPSVLVGGAFAIAVGTAWLRSRRRLPPMAAAVAATLVVLLAGASAARGGPPTRLTVRFLDVGQGDAALLVSPGGARVLVDVGPDPELVAQRLSALGVRRLDAVVATHPHADHVGGLAEVLTRFSVGLVIEPGCVDGSVTASEMTRAIADEGVERSPARAGDRFTIADLVLDVLAPDRCWTGSPSDPNNDSVVIRARVGGDTVLLAGDCEVAAQEAMLAAGLDLAADVLKVPHHGGATSVPAFFAAVDAAVAVVSVGQPNDYGHPVAAVLDDITATGAQVYRTDEMGEIQVTFSPTGSVVVSAA